MLAAPIRFRIAERLRAIPVGKTSRCYMRAGASPAMTTSSQVADDHASPILPPPQHKVDRFPKAEGSSKSYWLDSVAGDELLKYRSTEDLPVEVEVAIIGSGLTGALCAYTLLHSPSPPSSVLLLEAREFCSGATGRNAGHCKPDQWRGFAKYRRSFGDEQALKILKNERETWKRLVGFVEREKVDCELWTGKTMDVIMTPELASEATKLLAEYQAAGGETDHLGIITDPVEAETRSGVRRAKMIISWDASTLSPWKLVAHLARQSLDRGLNLQTGTPVTSVCSTSKDSRWRLTTPRGDVLAKSVVHATNAYAPALLSEFEEVIKPGPHMCNAVIPPSLEEGTSISSQGLKDSYSVMYPHGIHTMNPRMASDDGVHIISAAPNNPSLTAYLAEDGSRAVDDGLANYPPIDEVVTDFAETALGWSNPEFLYSWSGIIGRTGDSVPLIGAIPGKPGQWICAGHNAHGMSRIFTAAPGLARLIQGGTWEDTGLPECFEVTPERLERLRESAKSATAVRKPYHPLR